MVGFKTFWVGMALASISVLAACTSKGGGTGGSGGTTGSTTVIDAGPPATGAFVWAKRYGDASYQGHGEVAADADGNVYWAAGVDGTIDLGGGPLTGEDGDVTFLAKLDASGKHLWSKRIGNWRTRHVRAVAADASGVVVLLQGVANAPGTEPVPPTSGMSGPVLYVVKYDPAGNLLWTKLLGHPMETPPPPVDAGTGGDGPTPPEGDQVWSEAIAIDGEGNAVVVGEAFGTIDFGDAVRTAPYYGSAFVLKLAPGGDTRWSRAFPMTGIPVDMRSVRGVTVDHAGNIAVAAQDFVAFTPAAKGEELTMVVARLAPNGDVLWHQRFGSGKFAGIAADPNDHLLVGGYLFGGDTNFAGEPFAPGEGPRSFFFAKLDASGKLIWNRTTPAMGSPYVAALAADHHGNLVACGYYQLGPIDLGGGSFGTAGSSWDAFAAKLDASGKLLWAKPLGTGAGNRGVNAVTIGAEDRVIVSGYFDGTTDFGGGALTSAGGDDGYIVTLAP